MVQQQTFGRRGRPAPAPGAPRGASAGPSAPDLPPQLIAALLRPQQPENAAEPAKAGKIAWSLRAAVLAGLVAGLLNAAVRATSILDLGGLFDQVPLGEAKMPVAVMLVAAGLWGGARASALALLCAHSLLGRLGRTGYLAYALCGAAASLAYALLATALGFGPDHSLIVDGLSGLAAGFFYRLFAARQ